MYLIEFDNDGVCGKILDQRYDNDVISAILNIGYNVAGSLTVSIPFNHANFNKIHGLSTLIKVYRLNGTGRKWMFSGRVTTADEDFYRTGTFVCEGILAMLCDSIVRKYEFQGTPIDYVRQLIEQHNSQVTEDKQFIIRTLDIADVDSNNNIVRSSSQYPNTMNELTDKVIDPLKVYVSVEDVDGKYMIDIMQSISDRNSQPVELGGNMINLVQTKEMSDIKTVIIPLGCEAEDGSRLTVNDVNNGLDYVYDQEAVNRYGVIVGIVEFDDITLPENLLRKGRAYLKECINPVQTIKIDAVDMALCDSDVKSIELGWTHVRSDIHGIDSEMLLVEMNIDLIYPENNTYTLGSTALTSTSMNTSRVREISRKVQSIRTNVSKRIEDAVKNATQLITGAKGGYVILDGDNNGYPERILIMDNMDKTLARNVLQINKNGIGFSTDGIDGPYKNAWTIDGNFLADFITAGTMLADRIRGGNLEAGGECDGVISVLDAEGNIVATMTKDGVDVKKGSIRGAGVTIGGTDDAAGTLTVLDAEGNIVATMTKDGVDVKKGSISGASITSENGTQWVKISAGSIMVGHESTVTGKINFVKGGLEFRGNSLNFCMDTINCGTSMNDTSLEKAYTGDIKYSVKQTNGSIKNIVMEFRNGILMDNGDLAEARG